MCLRKAVSVLPFFVALGVGIAGGFISRSFGDVVPVAPPSVTVPAYVAEGAPLRTADLKGTWRGSWGEGERDCTLDISRVEGGKFYGTLRKAGFRVAFEGTLDPASGQVFLRETKVLNPGPEASGWSLGNNVGFISTDAQTLAGTGQDEYAPYTWYAAKQ